MQKSQSVMIAFTEEMHGYYDNIQDLVDIQSETVSVYQDAAEKGRSKKQSLKFVLTIKIDDIDQFLRDLLLEASATGFIECSELGGELSVTRGQFNLFLNSHEKLTPDSVKEMHYLLWFVDARGNRWTFFGFKSIRRLQSDQVWEETTTLYTRLFAGHLERGELLNIEAKYWGILRLDLENFSKQLTSFRTEGPNFWCRANGLYRFIEIFAENLWEAYQVQLFQAEPELWSQHKIPINTISGVKSAEVTTIPVETNDGLGITLTRFKRGKSKNPVLLIHGLTSSSDMFIMPEHYNLVQYLLDHGYEDVWSLDWRGSRRFYYNLQWHRQSIDETICFDIPRSIDVLRAYIDSDSSLHVICHCVGSIAFMASLATGQVKGVRSVISNSVSLTPRVSLWSRLKLIFAPALVEYLLQLTYVSPQMSRTPVWTLGGFLSRLVSLFHRECKQRACHMVSFMWGSGHPAAFQHQNLSSITHARLDDIFGGTSMNYYRHIRKMVFAGASVPYKKILEFDLPRNYLEAFLSTQAIPTLLVSGSENHIFPNSNQETYFEIKKAKPEANVEYLEIPAYGHQDVFIGRSCDRDVFPYFIEFLNKHRG